MIESANPVSMPSVTKPDRSRLVFVLSLIYVGLLPLLYALRYKTVAPIYSFAGDTFYYLDIARHSLHTHGFTFDGEFMTNGFHPLWEYTLIALARIHLLNFTDGPAPLLRVYFLDLLLLALGAAIFCASATRSLNRQLLALLIASPGLLWCITGLIDSRIGATWSYLNGMESALALFCFACALYVVGKAPHKAVNLFLCSTFLGLGTLARLDDVFIALGIAAIILLQTPAALRPQVAWSVLPFPALVAAYLAYNWFALGILLPISGGTKAGIAIVQNLKWTLALFLPIVTGDGPAALLPGSAQYYGFGERSGRLLQMILPALTCAVELFVRFRNSRTARHPSLLDGMCAGVILKAAYNFFFVQAWYQGFWYYTLSLFIANLVVVLWLDRALKLLPFHSSALLPWKLLLIHAFAVLFTFNLFISKRNFDGPIQEQRLLIDSTPLARKLKELGATRILEFDDGFTSYVANLPAAAGLGLALDPESVRALYRGEFLPLIYRRGYRVLVAHGAYGTAVDNQVAALNAGRRPSLWEIHGSEFARFTLRPLGGDGSPDGMRYYELVPLTP